MKKLLLLALLSTPVMAEKTYCEVIQEYATVVMKIHQEGETFDKAMDSCNGDGVCTTITIAAYTHDIQPTQAKKDRLANSFGVRNYFLCQSMQ